MTNIFFRRQINLKNKKIVKNVIFVPFTITALLFYMNYTENRNNVAFKKDNQESLKLVHDEQDAIVTAEDIFLLQRQFIEQEKHLFHYDYADPAKIEDFIPELNGNPIKNLLVTTWRSGSTFLGDVLNSVPSSYLHYEPLVAYNITQIRGPPNDEDALSFLKKLFSCNYEGSDMQNYLESISENDYFFFKNSRLWHYCTLYPDCCLDQTFLEGFCKLFPIQNMKTVRMRLNVAGKLLEDERFNLKIILLVRDPRGIMNSRWAQGWCVGNPDCDSPSTLCNDMIADYKAAAVLTKKYPTKFMAVRYEDLCLDTTKVTRNIFKFYGLSIEESTRVFLDSHTKEYNQDIDSPSLNSKENAFSWRNKLSLEELKDIEGSCLTAMRLWGYNTINNTNDLNNFDPLKPYSLE